MLGDRWSLLIIRGLMVRGLNTYKYFQESGEGIATNILADRLRWLESHGIIRSAVLETDGRRMRYRLAHKGIDLAGVPLELLVWGVRHEKTAAPEALNCSRSGESRRLPFQSPPPMAGERLNTANPEVPIYRKKI